MPDTNHVGQVEDRSVFVDCLSSGRGYVGFDAADFNGFAGGLAAVFLLVIYSIFFGSIASSLVAVQTKGRGRTKDLLVLNTNNATLSRGVRSHFCLTDIFLKLI